MSKIDAASGLLASSFTPHATPPLPTPPWPSPPRTLTQVASRWDGVPSRALPNAATATARPPASLVCACGARAPPIRSKCKKAPPPRGSASVRGLLVVAAPAIMRAATNAASAPSYHGSGHWRTNESTAVPRRNMLGPLRAKLAKSTLHRASPAGRSQMRRQACSPKVT